MSKQENEFAFEKINYQLLLGGLAVVVIGFLLMIGGGTDNPNEFTGKELFNAQRITVAPVVVILGYVFIIYAIMKKPKANS